MTDSHILSLNNVRASAGKKQVLDGISFGIAKGEIHVLMGPNGSGKSTLAQVIMGNPAITLDAGSIEFAGEDITKALPDERAKKGLFVGFQHPAEIPGVGQVAFVRSVLASRLEPLAPADVFTKSLESSLERVGLGPQFLERNVNEGFSGGEKKRNEVFQLSVFRPKLTIMDEIDSGLDVDGSRMVGDELSRFVADGGSLLVITHSAERVQALNPHAVYIMKGGRIVKQGNAELLNFVHEHGFESL